MQTQQPEEDKQSRREFYEQKIKQIDEKMSRAQMGEETKFKVIPPYHLKWISK